MAPAVQVVYSRERSLGSVAVRAASWWAQWGHCGLVTPEGTVIEAMLWQGVVETPMSVFVRRASKFKVVDVACPDPAAAVAFARAQLGKPYDLAAVVAFPFREPWHRENRWFCSELVEAAIQKGGRTRFRVEARRIAPNPSYIVT